MSEPSFGTWLRRERERRGATLKTISDQTKVSVPFLQGLETDDLSKWPTGIFRRAFVRSYATAIGLDPDEVIRRFEREHRESEPVATDGSPGETAVAESASPVVERAGERPRRRRDAIASKRVRVLGTVADLTVVLMLGLGFAAAGSRLLWPVLLVATYYALGVLLTGTSPMVALLGEQAIAESEDAQVRAASPHMGAERRVTTRRSGSRASRTHRQVRQRVQ